MPAPPARNEISDDYPNPSNAVARVGFGKLWDYITGLLGASGDAEDARAALGLDQVDNTSDADKPVSDATQTALNARPPVVDGVMDMPAQSGISDPWGSSFRVPVRGVSWGSVGSGGYPVVGTTRDAGDTAVWWVRHIVNNVGTAAAIGCHNSTASGTSAVQINVGASAIFRFSGAGGAAKPGGGSWTDTSDADTKDNIEDWLGGLDEILGLRVRQWTFKPETGRDPTVVYRGLVAQEAELVAPTLVHSGPGALGSIQKEDMRSLDPSDLVYMLVNAVQTLHARLAAAEANVAALEAQP